MKVTDEMAEAAIDALDNACIAFHRNENKRASVTWTGFMRKDRVAAMRAALEAALSTAAQGVAVTGNPVTEQNQSVTAVARSEGEE